MINRHLFRQLPALITCLLLLLPSSLLAGPVPQPSAKDKCPVCGMFVSKYPEWVTSITFKDGRTEFFDGAKDLFRYYHFLKRFAKNRNQSEISEIRVKDYYSLTFIDARNAWYVIGSDVLGPMGKEAIPFARENNARAFLKDHHGTRILRFSGITTEVLKGME